MIRYWLVLTVCYKDKRINSREKYIGRRRLRSPTNWLEVCVTVKKNFLHCLRLHLTVFEHPPFSRLKDANTWQSHRSPCNPCRGSPQGPCSISSPHKGSSWSWCLQSERGQSPGFLRCSPTLPLYCLVWGPAGRKDLTFIKSYAANTNQSEMSSFPTLWIMPAECRCLIPHNIW